MSLFHLIAPSGYCIKQHAALRGIQRLTDAGHQVNNVEVIARRCERFAGTETERLEDLNSLARLTTPNTIVLSVRGGYGPMLVANFGADELNAFTEHHFWLALRNKTFTIEWQGEGPTCQTEGTLWGGNLAMLISLIGTPWMPKIENGILVLEDINEHPFRVERMLLQLYHAGILPRQKAIILGSFSGSTPNDYDAGYNLESVYAFLRSRLSIPLITGLDFGHEQRTVTLPLGAHAILNNTQEGTQLTISGHPVLKM